MVGWCRICEWVVGWSRSDTLNASLKALVDVSAMVPELYALLHRFDYKVPDSSVDSCYLSFQGVIAVNETVMKGIHLCSKRSGYCRRSSLTFSRSATWLTVNFWTATYRFSTVAPSSDIFLHSSSDPSYLPNLESPIDYPVNQSSRGYLRL